jgi:hypothetical protein
VLTPAPQKTMVASVGCLPMPLLRHLLIRFSTKHFAINSSRIPPQHKPSSDAKSGLDLREWSARQRRVIQARYCPTPCSTKVSCEPSEWLPAFSPLLRPCRAGCRLHSVLRLWLHKMSRKGGWGTHKGKNGPRWENTRSENNPLAVRQEPGPTGAPVTKRRSPAPPALPFTQTQISSAVALSKPSVGTRSLSSVIGKSRTRRPVAL